MCFVLLQSIYSIFLYFHCVQPRPFRRLKSCRASVIIVLWHLRHWHIGGHHCTSAKLHQDYTVYAGVKSISPEHVELCCVTPRHDELWGNIPGLWTAVVGCDRSALFIITCERNIPVYEQAVIRYIQLWTCLPLYVKIFVSIIFVYSVIMKLRVYTCEILADGSFDCPLKPQRHFGSHVMIGMFRDDQGRQSSREVYWATRLSIRALALECFSLWEGKL